MTSFDGREQHADERPCISRRQLFQFAGVAGLASIATACSAAGDGAPTPASPGLAPAVSSPRPAVPEPLTPAALPPQPADSAVMLCREAWGARPPSAEGTFHTPSRMTIHHTAIALGDNSYAPTRLREHQHYHQDSQGWIDIAYHVGVDRNGNIYELRSPQLVGDTATNYDPTGHFLVVCEGNFEEEEVTEEQLHSAALAFAWAAQSFGIATDTLAGHRDVSHDTACPGANLYAHIESGDLKRRVDALAATGGVDLRTVCGPEASLTIAAIEAGH